MADYTQEQLDKKIGLHRRSLEGDDLNEYTEFTDKNFSGLSFKGAKLSSARFSDADITKTDFRDSCLHRASMDGAHADYATFTGADLRFVFARRGSFMNTNFYEADLTSAKMSHSDCRRACLQGANLINADFSVADLRGADLRGACIEGVTLREANLIGANLSGATGLLDQSEWISQLEHNKDGVICYKSFDSNYPPPDYWKISEGSIIEENVNPCRTVNCECGINVAKREWRGFYSTMEIWKCLIRWEWLPGVVVPYNTEGKFRTAKLELLEIETSPSVKYS